MEIIKIANSYLRALYLKSKYDFAAGYSHKTITKLLGLDRTQASNAMLYLADKKLIDTQTGFGDNVKLTSSGIDFALKLGESKIFKIIRFKSYTDIPSSKDGIEILYHYDLIDENEIKEPKTIKISISGSLYSSWGFQVLSNQISLDFSRLAKILLQIGKDKIIEKIREGTLNDNEELMLLTSNYPDHAPYNPENLIDPQNAEYEIEIGERILSEEIKENKLAAEIIENRDFINTIFYEKHKENLLLLKNERNLLDFFKTAKSEEEFSHCISSLGEVSRQLNTSILRNLTNEKNTQIGSVALLEKLITSLGSLDKSTTEILRQIGRIRMGYPIHSDISGVVEGYKYFNISYPVTDYQKTWTVLLNNYLTSLKQLKETLANAYNITE